MELFSQKETIPLAPTTSWAQAVKEERPWDIVWMVEVGLILRDGREMCSVPFVEVDRDCRKYMWPQRERLGSET